MDWQRLHTDVDFVINTIARLRWHFAFGVLWIRPLARSAFGRRHFGCDPSDKKSTDVSACQPTDIICWKRLIFFMVFFDAKTVDVYTDGRGEKLFRLLHTEQHWYWWLLLSFLSTLPATSTTNIKAAMVSSLITTLPRAHVHASGALVTWQTTTFNNRTCWTAVAESKTTIIRH